MPTPDRLTLTAEHWSDLLRNRAYVEFLGDFVPRSSAQGRIDLDPAATWQDITTLLPGFEVVKVANDNPRWLLILRRGPHVVGIDCQRGRTRVEALDTGLGAEALLAETLKALGARARPDDPERNDGVWTDFCVSGRHGTESRSQFIRCPAWPSIRDNYPDATRAALDALIALPDLGRHGQLILWHGPTGTGKTFALRAAMLAWRDRFLPTVLADPGTFAEKPDYYFDLASDSRDEAMNDPDLPGEFEEALGKGGKEPPRRRLFILEDSAPLLVRDDRKGSDVLGRLLNMTDGLIGQGREDLFLVTFNEEVERIDPAFVRPGRCVANIRFPLFEREAAEAWLRAKGKGADGVTEQTSLAELYAKSGGGPIRESAEDDLKGPQGFGGGKRT
ncbi:MAG: hypothetical protein AAB074_02430 [Planctomycetota bacterium]